MLLTIHNLPAKYRYSDVKGLLVEKCGLAELILDNLVLEGTTKKVTVGVADEGDAAVLVRKVNGLYVDGLQLYVEDARKKRPGSEQPFRSTKEYKLSQEAQHQPHYGQATMMPSQMQPQYADPQAYMSQNPVLHTNSLAMQSPYMNTQPIMQGYGMAAGIDMVPQLCSQDNSMVGYQADDLPYQSGGLSDVPAQQPNWAAQNTNNQHWDQGQEYQKWSNSQQKNWDQDRSEQNQWVRNRSRSRSPARERSRHDTRSDSRRGKKSKQLTWEPRQGAKKDWHGRDGNAGTGYRRPPSPQRQRFSPQRRETSLQQPVDFNAREFRGNPDYLARHAPPEMLQQYEPDRNYSYEDLYQPTSSDPFEREDNDFPPNPAYFEPQDHPTPYGDHVKRPRDRRRSRSGDRSRPCFEGSSQSFRKRDERESWSDRKRPAPDRHEQFPNRAREHEFGAQDRRVQFPKRARENEFGAQDNRAGDRVYPVDKGKPGSKVAPGDYIPMRDRTWRAQTVSQIAKANALNETAKVVKYYKRAVSAKLDKLMRDEVNVSTSDMFLRYMQLHNDKKLLNACRRQVEMELKASSEERTADVEAALAGEKFKGAPAAKPNPKAGKPQPTGPKQQPNGPKTQPTTKKNSNNTAVSGRIPNYPAGDKQIFEDAKKAMQMEFAGEMTYSLDAPEDQALESDLDNITMLIKENCGASGEEPSPDDNYVAKSADAIADELRTVMRLHVTKRILNVTNHLTVRIYCHPKNISKDVLSDFLTRRGVTSLRKAVKSDTYLATVDTFAHYDKLLGMKKASVAEGLFITIEPLQLIGPKPKRVRTKRKTANSSDLVETAPDKNDVIDLEEGEESFGDAEIGLNEESFVIAEELAKEMMKEAENGFKSENLEQGEEYLDEEALDLANPDEDDLLDY